MHIGDLPGWNSCGFCVFVNDETAALNSGNP